MNGFAALDIPACWRYVVNKAGAANAAPALKYKFYFTPHLGGYTEFGIIPLNNIFREYNPFCSEFSSSPSFAKFIILLCESVPV